MAAVHLYDELMLKAGIYFVHLDRICLTLFTVKKYQRNQEFLKLGYVLLASACQSLFKGSIQF